MNHPQTLPLAHTVPYFKTGRSTPDSWINKTKQLLRKLGATNIDEGFLSISGHATFGLSFKFGQDTFRVTWPVLTPKDPGDESAARIQAATYVFHQCKEMCIAAAVLGPRSAFVSYLLLPTGRTVVESSNSLIAEHVKPAALLGNSGQRP